MKITFDENTFSELQDEKKNSGGARTDKNCKVAFCVEGFESDSICAPTDGTLKLIGVMENVDVWCDDGAAFYITKDGKSHLVIEAIFTENYDEFVADYDFTDIDPKIKELDGKVMFVRSNENIYRDIDGDGGIGELNNTPTAPIIGDFKPKRKFLNFVSAVNGVKVRFIRDIAFLKGEKLSGTLEGVVFKITICDEGTINFEEVDTERTDVAQRQRLLDDIEVMDVTGYAQKFVVSGIQFADKDGGICYLEVEHQKPIDRLRSFFDDVDEERKVKETTLSTKGLSILDSLFGDSDESENTELSDDINIIDDENVIDVVEENKTAPALSYMEQQFQKMNEDKVNELKSRIDDTQKDVKKYIRDISFAESKLKETNDQLGVLETRLETMSPGDEPNGILFFVSEEQKNETGLDETTKGIADKIANLMNLKKDVLFDYLTGGFYKIRIAEKGDFENKETKFDKEILKKVVSIDPSAKISMIGNGEFEYRGDLTWHQLVSKMIRRGFEQEPDFDKLCNSNSYDSSVLNDGPEDSSIDMKNSIIDMAKGLGMKDVKFGEDGIELVPEDKSNTEFKALKLRSYKEPTTLVVMGSVDHNDNNDFSITDDYSSFGVYVGGKKIKRKYGYECDGFVSIMTIPEFQKLVKSNPHMTEDGGGCDSFILPNFVGDIEVAVKLEDGSYTTDFDLGDYIQHQELDGEDGYVDVFMNFPEGTQVIDMENHQFPTQVIRDLKLEKILN